MTSVQVPDPCVLMLQKWFAVHRLAMFEAFCATGLLVQKEISKRVKVAMEWSRQPFTRLGSHIRLILLAVCLGGCSKLSGHTDMHHSGRPAYGTLFEKLEHWTAGRIGVAAVNTADNSSLQYRGDERFPLCSTFKLMAAAAILHRSLDEPDLLKKHILYSATEVTAAGYAPVTIKHLSTGMSIADLCAAAIQYSDNAGVNLLMKELGGPKAVTAFAQTIGDNLFRLDRWEPELNSAIPNDPRDTSTPASTISGLYRLH
nr:beta-lactamase [uncultured bacterium]